MAAALVAPCQGGGMDWRTEWVWRQRAMGVLAVIIGGMLVALVVLALR